MKVITVGRSPDNNIVINDVKVSRTHLQIVQNDSGICSVVDLNSVNGTYVNGQKIAGEVRLQPNDAIRIGDTTLLWQEYIKPSSFLGEQKPINQVAPPATRTDRLWLWCAICVAVVVLLAGGIGLYVYYNGKERQKQESIRQAYEVNEERLRQEAEQLEAKRLQDKADDELFRQALRDDRDNNRKLAEAKQKEADEAKEQAEAAAAAQHKAETARIAAEKAKAEADKAKETAEQNSKKAIQKAEGKANQAISEANTERDSANKKAKLTEEFYEEYAVMKSEFAKQVCTQLKHELPKEKNDAKIFLKDLFSSADNKGKQAIIDTIQNVKQQNSKTKVNGSGIKSDSLKTTKDADQTDDKMSIKSDE